MGDNGRDKRGRFGPKNPGGPGKPRRAIEFKYLAALGESVSLNDWRGIVEKAEGDALSGDWRAREWLARYLVGVDAPPTLIGVAAAENGSTTAEAASDLVGERALMLSGGYHFTAFEPGRWAHSNADRLVEEMLELAQT